MLRWWISLALAVLLGAGSLYWVSDGFTALTAETARRQAVAHTPRPIPDARIIHESGQVDALLDDLRRDGRVAIVDFFYTRCTALCLAQGVLTARIQDAILAGGLQDRVRLITLSFDPRDLAPDLRRYAQRMGADGAVWQFMGLPDDAQRAAVLARFGITVVPAPLGEFEHNAALHVVSPDGHLTRITELDEPGVALMAAQALATSLHLGRAP